MACNLLGDRLRRGRTRLNERTDLVNGANNGTVHTALTLFELDYCMREKNSKWNDWIILCSRECSHDQILFDRR